MKIQVWHGKTIGLGIQYEWFSSRWIGIFLPFVVIYFLFDEHDGKPFFEIIDYWKMEK